MGAKAALALAAGVALGGGGAFAAQAWLAHGVLVVTSEPAGAHVLVEGRAAPTPTPAVVEGLPLTRPITVVVSAPDRYPVTVALEPELGQLVRRVHAQLPAALGAVTIESDPPGAEVQIDDRPAGMTPFTVQNVRLDERHRIDLSLPGYELDQFVVLPERDGRHFHRKLAAPDRRRPGKERGAE
jgi:hypothetical protein